MLAVLTRFAATCAGIAALAISVAVEAQQRQPGQEGPPSVEFPPPTIEQGPRQRDEPPPRVEGAPPSRDDPPSRIDPPPRVERQPGDDRPPPRADRRLGPAERCGAVAYTADGAFGGAYGMEDCTDAERLAVDECRRESTDKADCSRGVVIRRDSWFYVQFCQRGRDWTTHITTEKTLSETNRNAAEWSRKSKFGPENCRLVPNGLFHSGGLHVKM